LNFDIHAFSDGVFLAIDIVVIWISHDIVDNFLRAKGKEDKLLRISGVP
jgi:hypothetical protein